MANDYIGIFDVIGPVMVGPSSSHTSGAVTIAWMARQIFKGTPKSVTFTLYGSFAETYMGHGTDRALIGGMLGYKPDDIRIRDAYREAKKNGLSVRFISDKDTQVKHPNTVDVVMEGKDGYKLLIRGESVGGGRVRIRRLNDIEVDFTGEYSTLIISHRDEQGVASFITGSLAIHSVNIAYMKIFREDKGKKAITVIETDDSISKELTDELINFKGIRSVHVIEA